MIAFHIARPLRPPSLWASDPKHEEIHSGFEIGVRRSPGLTGAVQLGETACVRAHGRHCTEHQAAKDVGGMGGRDVAVFPLVMANRFRIASSAGTRQPFETVTADDPPAAA